MSLNDDKEINRDDEPISEARVIAAIKKLTREQLERFVLDVGTHLYGGYEPDPNDDNAEILVFRGDKEWEHDTLGFVQQEFDALGLNPESIEREN